MKHEKSDISLLLIVLVLFSASIGLLHGFKITQLSAATADTKQLIVSQQDTLDLLSPHLLSDNMPKMAATLLQLGPEAQDSALEKILKNDGIQLSHIQKIKLFLALAGQEEELAQQAKMYDLLGTNFLHVPLFSLGVGEYPNLISSIRSWVKKGNKKEIFNKWKNLSIIDALKQNDPSILRDLYTNGIRLNPKEASIVLHRVVDEQRDVGFVPLLLRNFGAEIHYAIDGKRTALIKAVESNNPDMVRVLIDEGANPRLKLDSVVGSALQIAAARGMNEIQRILTGY